nr:ATP synthase F0 subunit 8 [Polypheretima elongata]
MPHLSPMSWLMAIITFWLVMLLFTSNMWWTSSHTFEAKSPNKISGLQGAWFWN